jgi:tetratricopeptide (TPR) repeat protein
MLRFLFLSVLIGSILLLSAGGLKKKKESDFQKNFNIAKQHLSKREINEALPYLLYLNKKQPENSNLKYLIGLCYAELEIVNPRTLQLLTESSNKASLEYDPNTIEERRVPIYVYYYLSIAYSQNKLCDLAEKYRNTFMDIYPHNDSYYPDESMRWINSCKKMRSQPEEVPLPDFPGFKPYVSPKEKPTMSVKKPIERIIKPTQKEPQEIKTQILEYSTQYPIYGVQLGAFKEAVPVSRFKDLKNVDAFMDKDGWIRYVVGHFSIYSQAESLLKIIRDKGYIDAFVVNVNNEKKFKDEVVSINNINIRANPLERVEYRIQIGAFKEEISKEFAGLYLKIEGIKEYRELDLTFLTVGKFKTYLEAKAYCQGIIDVGINDAFVIALSSGKKIPLQHLNEFKN